MQHHRMIPTEKLTHANPTTIVSTPGSVGKKARARERTANGGGHINVMVFSMSSEAELNKGGFEPSRRRKLRGEQGSGG